MDFIAEEEVGGGDEGGIVRIKEGDGIAVSQCRCLVPSITHSLYINALA